MIAANETIAHRAVQLRTGSQKRLPTIDGLIAATAVVEGLTLVHRDPHLGAVKDPEFRQLRLAEK